MIDIDIDYVRQVLDYDPDLGEFRWRTSPSNNTPAGSAAGCVNPTTGYVGIRVRGKTVKAHRLAFAIACGAVPDDKVVDHINGIKTDNRLCNLRLASISENQQNRSDASARSNTGYLGVSFHKASGKLALRNSVLK